MIKKISDVKNEDIENKDIDTAIYEILEFHLDHASKQNEILSNKYLEY